MDIFFISFRESNCEENWARTKLIHNDAKRLHGIVGIDTVHLICDQVSNTEFFWTIDGDNWLLESLNYDYESIETDLIMFKAIDPIHEQPTALGGVKLWRKNSMVNTNMDKGDFSLNATKEKQVLDIIFSETRFNASAFDCWKTSFRHCVKCLTVFRDRQYSNNIDYYLNQWAKCSDIIKPNAEWAYLGYTDAQSFVTTDSDKISNINDYAWLETYFRRKYDQCI